MKGFEKAEKEHQAKLDAGPIEEEYKLKTFEDLQRDYRVVYLEEIQEQYKEKKPNLYIEFLEDEIVNLIEMYDWVRIGKDTNLKNLLGWKQAYFDLKEEIERKNNEV